MGPDGGFGVIVFADRRGFAIRPVKKEIAERVDPQQAQIGGLLGIDMRHPCPGAPAISTTFGPTERGHRNETFGSPAGWSEVAPRSHMAAALLGEPTCGPVLLFVRAAPGALALPARTVDSEVCHVVVDGVATIGGDALDPGCVRLDEAGSAANTIVAGPDGLSLVTIVADRRAWLAALETDATDAIGDPAWVASVLEIARDLDKTLAA